MKDANAVEILSRVLSWDTDEYSRNLPYLQLLAGYKYDGYQRFEPGRRFIESLSLWLNQFAQADRREALRLVRDHLVFVSDEEMRHLVRMSYPDIVVQERIRAVAEEQGIPRFRVAAATSHARFKELQIKSLYLGLSDGAHTNELRRAAAGAISNEQIWQAYELGDEKAESMRVELGRSLEKAGMPSPNPAFSVVWLVDDFSGSGMSYIRFDNKQKVFRGKIAKVFKQLVDNRIVDPGYYEVHLLLYIATRQAVDHIEYWAERFTAQHGYKPLQLRVVHVIEKSTSLRHDAKMMDLVNSPAYFDSAADDEHMGVGGSSARHGFAGCALPLVLAHNCPNNSVYLLWGPDDTTFFGLFPRVSRHRGA